MKKLLFITLFIISLNLFGQAGKIRNAMNMAAKMGEVMNLTDEEMHKIYVIRLEHLRRIDKLRRANLNMTRSEFNQLIKPHIINYHNKLFSFLGEENRKKWRAHKREVMIQ